MNVLGDERLGDERRTIVYCFLFLNIMIIWWAADDWLFGRVRTDQPPTVLSCAPLSAGLPRSQTFGFLLLVVC